MLAKTVHALTLAFACCAPALQAAAEPPHVTIQLPQGEQQEVNQVQLRFSDSVGALGDDKGATPAKVSCQGTELVPTGHWQNDRIWVADFATSLPQGVTCTVTPLPFTSIQGEAVTMPAPWSFHTMPPEFVGLMADRRRGTAEHDARFAELPPIEDDTAAVLMSSTPLDRASLVNLRCTVDGARRAVTLLDGEEARSEFDRLNTGTKLDDRIVVARCGKEAFRPHAKVTWTWGKSIASLGGVAVHNESERQYDLPYRMYGSAPAARGGSNFELGQNPFYGEEQTTAFVFESNDYAKAAKQLRCDGHAVAVLTGEKRVAAYHALWAERRGDEQEWPLDEHVVVARCYHAVDWQRDQNRPQLSWEWAKAKPASLSQAVVAVNIQSDLFHERRSGEMPVTAFFMSLPPDEALLASLRCSVNGLVREVTILHDDAEKTANDYLRRHPEGNSMYDWESVRYRITAQCGNEPWPANARIVWSWKDDVVASGDVQPAPMLRFMVRAALWATPTCSQMAGTADCDHRQPIMFDLSQDFSSEYLGKFTLQGSSGALYQPQPPQEDVKQTAQVQFNGPFIEGESLTLHWESDFTDIDGRPLVANGREHVKTTVLPTYLGMPERGGLFEGRAGKPLLWPLALRNTEQAIKVRTWHFGQGGAQSTPAMLALLENEQKARQTGRYRGNGNEGFNTEDLLLPFTASAALLQNLKQATDDHPAPAQLPEAKEQLVRSSGGRMEVVGIPLAGFGVWLVEADSARYREVQAQRFDLRWNAARSSHNGSDPNLQSDLNDMRSLDLASREERALRTAVVQVTNLHVHARMAGTGTSLIWLTAQDSGEPVAGASVEIWSPAHKLLATGTSDAAGRVEFQTGSFPAEEDPHSGRANHPTPWRWVVARSGDDVCALDTWADSSTANLPRHTPLLMHTVLDRTWFRPGETVSMEHLARLAVPQGWEVPTLQPGKLRIADPMNQVVADQTVEWRADGSAESHWTFPEHAKLGQYTYTVLGADGTYQSSGVFQLDEFRLPQFDASIRGSTLWRGNRQQIRLAAALSFKTGGGASGQRMTITGSYRHDRLWAPYGEVSQELDAIRRAYDFEDEESLVPAPPAFEDLQLKLDRHGRAETTIAAPKSQYFLTLRTEMSFLDAGGEIKRVQAMVPVFPQRHMTGLHVEQLKQPHRIAISALVIDDKYRPLAGQQVTLDTIEADRKRDNSVGWHVEVTGERNPACSGKTDSDGVFHCEIDWNKETVHDGWLFRARTGGASTASIFSSRGEFTWRAQLPPQDVTPPMFQRVHAEADAKVGDVEHYEIRSPFLPATLLFTVEREGLLTSQVKKLTHEVETIDLPIKPAFAPHVQVHAILVRGTGQANDISPSTGANSVEATQYLEIDQVSNLLDVVVTPAKKKPRPGETLLVGIQVNHALNHKPAAGARVTLLAVDDILLEQHPNTTWDILNAFWSQRTIQIAVSDLVATRYLPFLPGVMPNYLPPAELNAMRTVEYKLFAPEPSTAPVGPAMPDSKLDALLRGKRDQFDDFRSGRAFARVSKSELGIDPIVISAPNYKRADVEMRSAVQVITSDDIAKLPGAGTKDSPPVRPRTDFSTLAHWQTEITLDANGHANLPVKLTDSLTNWRLVAIATEGAAYFGHGDTVVTAAQPVQLLSGLPLTVRSHDELQQRITVRNTTGHAVKLELTAHADISAAPDLPYAGSESTSTLQTSGLQFTRQLNLGAYGIENIDWQVTIPQGAAKLAWTFEAQDGGGDPALRDAMVVQQTVVPQAPVTVRESTQLMVEGKQTIPVAQPPDAISNAGGLTIAWQDSLVGGAMRGARSWMAHYPYACMEQRTSKAVVSGMPEDWAAVVESLPRHMDDQGLVAYFPPARNEEAQGSEILTAYLLDIADAYGLAWPEKAKARMQGGLRRALENAVFKDWANDGSKFELRLALQATIAPDLGRAKVAVPKDLSTLSTNGLVDWLRYLLKTPASAARDAAIGEAANQLRARYDIQGTRAIWHKDGHGDMWWYMWSEDVAAARATLLAQHLSVQDTSWKGDVALLINDLVKRQERGGWRTTTANAWSVAAMRNFNLRTEAGPVAGTSMANFNGSTRTVDWPQPGVMAIPWKQQGERGTLELSHEGSGHPWATVQVLAAKDSKETLFHGVKLHRSVQPYLQRVPGQWLAGDVMQVTLDMEADRELGWVVVNDPIPSGATILTQDVKSLGWAWWWTPSFTERGGDSFRGYYKHTWSGKWSVSYLVQLNNSGSFHFPPTRLEVMYAPEIFAEVPNQGLTVGAMEEK